MRSASAAITSGLSSLTVVDVTTASQAMVASRAHEKMWDAQFSQAARGRAAGLVEPETA